MIGVGVPQSERVVPFEPIRGRRARQNWESTWSCSWSTWREIFVFKLLLQTGGPDNTDTLVAVRRAELRREAREAARARKGSAGVGVIAVSQNEAEESDVAEANTGRVMDDEGGTIARQQEVA